MVALQARRLSNKARIVFIMFNNCHKGNAVRNALQLREMLNAKI